MTTFEAAGAVWLLTQTYNQTIISKFNQVKLVQIRDTLCRCLGIFSNVVKKQKATSKEAGDNEDAFCSMTSPISSELTAQASWLFFETDFLRSCLEDWGWMAEQMASRGGELWVLNSSHRKLERQRVGGRIFRLRRLPSLRTMADLFSSLFGNLLFLRWYYCSWYFYFTTPIVSLDLQLGVWVHVRSSPFFGCILWSSLLILPFISPSPLFNNAVRPI